MSARDGKAGNRPRKEAFFVQVETGEDKTPIFFNATRELGKPMPFSKPLATCALRVNDGAVLFSLLKLSNRTRQNLAEQPLEMPRGPLARLDRKLASLGELPAGELRVEIGKVEALEGREFRLSLTRDENGVASVETLGEVRRDENGDVTAVEADEIGFELPRSALQVSIFLPSPKANRVVAMGFIGHVGKPETAETLARVVALVLNHATGLAEFRLLAAIERVNVPASPARFAVKKVARKSEDLVRFVVPVRMWQGEPPQPLAAGNIQVEVDLDTANPVSGRLLFHYTPSPEIAEHFEEYRSTFDNAVSTAFSQHLGADELTDIVCDIALGDVAAGTLGRLREAGGTVPGLDLLPKQWAPFPAA